MEILSYNFQDNFLTLRRLSVGYNLNCDDFVIKADFHRLWLTYILYNRTPLKLCKTSSKQTLVHMYRGIGGQNNDRSFKCAIDPFRIQIHVKFTILMGHLKF